MVHYLLLALGCATLIGTGWCIPVILKLNKYHNSDGKLRFMTFGRYPRHTRYCEGRTHCYCRACPDDELAFF